MRHCKQELSYIYQNDFVPSTKLIEKSLVLSHAEIIRVCEEAYERYILD